MHEDTQIRNLNPARALQGDQLEYRILGPLEVRRDGEPVEIGRYKLRALLALLLINGDQVVSTDRIIDEIWGEDAGTDRQNSLWVAISGLRSALDPERQKRTDGTVLLTRSPGYLINTDGANVDAWRFEQLAAEGRGLLDADPPAASLVLQEALALWRGHALEEFTYESFAQAEVARLEEMRLAAVEDRILADLRSGRDRELVGELESLVRQHRDLTVWDDGTLAAWADLGAEHAAEILLWGMTDETRNINWQIDDSNINNLRAAYRVLISG